MGAGSDVCREGVGLGWTGGETKLIDSNMKPVRGYCTQSNCQHLTLLTIFNNIQIF